MAIKSVYLDNNSEENNRTWDHGKREMRNAKLNKEENSQILVVIRHATDEGIKVSEFLTWMIAETGQFTSMTNTGRVDIWRENRLQISTYLL